MGKHPATRWAAPLVAAALLVGVPLAVTSSAVAEPALPDRTAQQLLVDLQGLQARPLSGEVTQTSNLGLPELPGFASPTVSDASLGSLLTLASGTHTWRVWTDGAQSHRLALVDGTNESDLIVNGTDAWLWSSADASAVHVTLPEKSATGGSATPSASPADVAEKILKNLDPTTAVETTRADVVAGRPVYELVLTPKQSGTKVGSVSLAVDSETKVPLRVQVIASDGTHAIDVAFTSVSFESPDAGIFTFTPPAGTTVTEKSFHSPGSGRAPSAAPASPRPTTGSASATDDTKVVGTGWTSVLVGKSPLQSSTSSDRTVTSLLEQLPRVSGTWGSGRLLDGPLFSVVLTDDGRVAVGAVTPDALFAALS